MSDVVVSKLKNTFDTPQPRYPTATIMTDIGKTKIKVLLSCGTERNIGHDCIWSSSIRNIGNITLNCQSQFEQKPELSTKLYDVDVPFMNLENLLSSNDKIIPTNNFRTNSFEYKKPTDNVNVLYLLSRDKLLRFRCIKRLGSNNYDGFTVSGGARSYGGVNIRRFSDTRYSDEIYIINLFSSEIASSFLEILN